MSKRCTTSAISSARTNVPWFGRMCTRPARSSRRQASRTDARPTPSCAAIDDSLTCAPGSSSPAMIIASTDASIAETDSGARSCRLAADCIRFLSIGKRFADIRVYSRQECQHTWTGASASDPRNPYMKVTAVEVLPVHPGWRKNLVFVRIATDAGIIGWGEAYSQYDRDRPIAAQAEELGRYLVGRDPFRIRHFLQIAFDDFAQRRSSLEWWCAVSGIEAALWDIVGKACNQPVYALLGGTCRQRIRVHAIALADAMAPFEPYWFEEPCQVENIDALAEVRAATSIPVVSGEAMYGR